MPTAIPVIIGIETRSDGIVWSLPEQGCFEIDANYDLVNIYRLTWRAPVSGVIDSYAIRWRDGWYASSIDVPTPVKKDAAINILPGNVRIPFDLNAPQWYFLTYPKERIWS